jgi:hypothetical protein
MRSPSATAENAIHLPMPAQPVALALNKVEAPKPSPVEKPLAPPVQSKTEAASAPPNSANAGPDPTDPQANLKTALQDIARLTRAEQLVEEYQTYTPPDEIDPAMVQQLQYEQQHDGDMTPPDPTNYHGPPTEEDKQFWAQLNDAVAHSYEELESQTPTYNATGDKATYQYTRPPIFGTHEGPIPLDFVKIDGKWYEDGLEE